MSICDLQPAIRDLEDKSSRGVPVAIAGAGLITVLGNYMEETWTSLLRAESISDHSIVQKQWGGRSRVVGLALDAAREAIGESAWSNEELHSAALVVGTSKGAIIEWMESAEAEVAGVGGVAEAVARELGISARLTVSAACASGLLALIRGVLMIKAGEAKRVLVVASEASVHELFVGSFRRLGVLAKPGEGCRPFDRERSGFLMSEAGAAVCLERAGDGEAQGILVERMAMGADATHLISGDEQGRTLRALLDDVLDGRPVDLIHAHGTGTAQNDEMESGAIEDCVMVGGRRPALYSHKGALGHALGAAGLISVVLNRMCHERQTVPPALVQRSVPLRRVSLLNHAQKRTIRRSIALAAGFGGAIGAVSLLST